MAWAQHSSRTAPLPPDWKARRQATLERDGHRCTVRDCATPTDRLEVDHVNHAADHDHLRTLCHGHHAEHTAAQAAAVRHRYRARRDAEPHPGAV